jgi:hypothetical protein
MKKMLLISCVMLALTATAALAQGLNFSWGPECASDVLVTNKTFACNVNTGTNQMVASFKPSASHELFLALDAVIDGQASTGTVIPDWWQFKNAGACRILSMTVTAVGTGTAVNCIDAWSGASPTIDYYGDPVWNGVVPVPVVAGKRARMKIGVSTTPLAASAVDAGSELYAFTVNINNKNTMGTLICAGCSVPMAWVFNSIVPGYMDAGILSSEVISAPILNRCITWQGAVSTECDATPTQNKTWGQVKSLYR